MSTNNKKHKQRKTNHKQRNRQTKKIKILFAIHTYRMKYSCEFCRYRFRPRLLVDVSDIQLSTKVLGQSISMPICVSPTGAHRLANADGEKATARGWYSNLLISYYRIIIHIIILFSFIFTLISEKSPANHIPLV